MGLLDELIEKAEVWDDSAQAKLGMRCREGMAYPKTPRKALNDCFEVQSMATRSPPDKLPYLLRLDGFIL